LILILDDLKHHSDCFGDDPIIFGHPSVHSQAPQIYIGRISSDSIEHSITLNSTSLVLETSREIGAGTRVSVKLNPEILQRPHFDLYPGQIMCVEASNPSGDCLLVEKIIPLPLLEPAFTTGQDYMEYYKCGPQFMDSNEKLDGLKVIVVAGPYTTDESLTFEPLQELVDQLEQNMPDVIIMLGPFVVGEHPLLAEGKVDVDVDQVFRECVSPRLQRMKSANPGLQICLIPSQKDSCHPWVAFPQPPLGSVMSNSEYSKLYKLGLINNDGELLANLFPNPVQFTVNEIVFAVSNNDIISDIMRAHINRKERFLCAFSHIIEQRHFYPLFPPSANACLDSARALGSQPSDPCVLQVKPDVLILPSTMTHTIRNIEGVLCVNPGALCKSRVVGTFASLDIHCLQTDNMSDEDVFDHKVVDRTRVEVIKL
jgi:DNA polymerase alpha subunit B